MHLWPFSLEYKSERERERERGRERERKKKERYIRIERSLTDHPTMLSEVPVDCVEIV
jgi:hypothetical protein